MKVRIALPLPVFSTYTYLVPDHLAPYSMTGKRVIVPFGPRRLLGYIMGESDETIPGDRLRTIHCVLDDKPTLIPPVLELSEWISEYYMVPVGLSVSTTLPGVYNRLEEPVYRVTTSGLARRSRLNADEIEILDWIMMKKKTTLSEIQQNPGRMEHVLHMTEKGILSVHRPEGKDILLKRLYRLSDPSHVKNHLETLGRSPKGKKVLMVLMEENRPLGIEEITAWASCSPSTVQSLVKKGLVITTDHVMELKITPSTIGRDTGPVLHRLTRHQQNTFESIQEPIRKEQFRTFLLQGVTGSGKTEIYLHAINRTIREGKKALYLVPEIALTFVPTGRLRRLVGDRVAILHSGLNDRERTREFERISSGEVDVVVGPRSAVFAPLSPLGLIVVDEGQDDAYKQESAPRYHGRDVAVMRGKMEHAVVIIGSATPSLVTRDNAEKGRYGHLVLEQRVGDRPLPDVEIVNNLNEKPEPGEQGRVIFSARLKELMTEAFDRENQVMLLVTRKGYAPTMLCRMCGYNFPCPACSVTHTVHHRFNVLLCHYCNHRIPIPRTCPECRGELLQSIGIGTEKVAEMLEKYYPAIPYSILDRDTMSRRGKLQETLHRFSLGKTRCLIGTQMLAKGHDYPNVTVVGVLTTDQMLNFPDFRCSEKVFTLLTQVAGRSGRGEEPGKVIVQTSFIHHYAVTHALKHDYEGFYKREMSMRKALQYPPVTHMIACHFSSTSLRTVQKSADEFITRMRRHPFFEHLHVLGPAPSPLARLKGKHRYQVLIRGKDRNTVRKAVKDVIGARLSSTLTVDVDPYQFL